MWLSRNQTTRCHILYTCICHSFTSTSCGMMTFSPGEDVIAALLFVDTAFWGKLYVVLYGAKFTFHVWHNLWFPLLQSIHLSTLQGECVMPSSCSHISTISCSFLSVRVLQRNKTNRGGVCVYEEGRGPIDLFHKTGSHNCGGLQAQNVQCRPADQRPREEMMLQFKIEGSLQAEFLKCGMGGGQCVCVCVNLSLYSCFNLLAVPQGMCDLGSSTRDQTHAPYIVKTLCRLNHWTTREFPWSLLLETN